MNIITEILQYMRGYWVEWIFVLFSGTIAFLYKELKKNIIEMKKQHDNISLGVQVLLRNAIIYNYNKYKELGYCPVHAREDLEKMYKPYRNLSGNGVVEGLVKELLNMPTEKEE